VPARLGRDPLSEVPLRDPGVSRQHARIRADGEQGTGLGFVLEDAGSRGGVHIAGARLAGPLRLQGEGTLSFGSVTALQFEAAGDGRAVILRGSAGLDRDLLAALGPDPLNLGHVVPSAEGVALELGGGVARLVRLGEIPVRVDGHFVGAGCDLVHGDVVEVLGAAPLVFEVL
jgi:hypothetical protein